MAVVASEVSDAEHGRLWSVVNEAMPGMLKYRELTTRRPTIIRLTRSGQPPR